jgi:hypothetical protein
VAGIVAKLQSGLDFAQWWKEHGNLGGMAGAADIIHWPVDREKSLGMKLLLFRAFSEGRPDGDIAGFGFRYIYAGSNINANAQAVIDQIFMPMARELRRYLERAVTEVPAADRVVRLDHNSGPYREAMEALEKLERVLEEANDYPDAEDKERHIAEVSAAQRLLKSVRVGAVIGLRGSGLLYLTTHFVGTAIDTAATWVIEKLTALFGSIF